MEKLSAALYELESKIEHFSQKKEAVSQAPVGWHIQHSLLVLNQIIGALKTSDPSAYRPRFSLAKTFVYTFKKLPRGRIKAPDSVQPKEAVSIEALQASFQTARENLAAMNGMPANSFFQHPFFGNVNLKPAGTFLIIHTRHHIKIINDILR